VSKHKFRLPAPSVDLDNHGHGAGYSRGLQARARSDHHPDFVATRETFRRSRRERVRLAAPRAIRLVLQRVVEASLLVGELALLRLRLLELQNPLGRTP
jgi:hypothetical protein